MQIAIKTLVHDFNNDLTIITGVVSLIDKIIARGGSVKEIGLMVSRLKDKLDDIKNDLQDVIIGDEEICLEKYLEDTKSNLEDDYGVTISCKDNNSSFLMTVSKGKLHRFLKNIVKNAVEAGATHLDFFMSHNYFLVKDNGSGVPLSILKDINNNRMTSSKKGKNHGYGILSLKEFCQKHQLNFQIANSHTSQGAQITIKSNIIKQQKVS